MGIFDLNIPPNNEGPSNLASGSTTATTQPGLFGTAAAQPDKPRFAFGQPTGGGGGAFGQAIAQPTNPANLGGLFNAPPATAGQPAQAAPLGGFFGASAAKPAQGGGFFGQPTAQTQAGGLFGASQNQQQLQQQRPLDQTLRFGFGESQQTVAQAQEGKDPWWQEGRGMGVLRSIPQQMELIKDKWDPASLNSPLRTYIYQHVGNESEALKYSPGPGEDPNKWEEALQQRPGPEWVPVLARGFRELTARGMLQREQVAKCNMMLNEINNSLDIQLDTHRQKVAARLAESRRRHKVISQRTLGLAVKVQILKNRGYVMDNAEEELKNKLNTLEQEILDPAMNAREQEIWARMLGIRERARHLKAEMEKLQPIAQQDEEPLLDDESMKQARKTLNAYDTQLQHLQQELKLVHEEYADWEKLNRGSDPSRVR